MKFHALLLAALGTSVSSWSYSESIGSGISTFSNNEQQYEIFQQANAHPNTTTSVPVSLGGTNITLIVKISEFGLPRVDTQIDNPRAVLTTYNLGWNGSFNETFDHPGPTCFTTVRGQFPTSVTNQVGEDGNCSVPLGDECTMALQNTVADCDSPLYIPGACKDAFSMTSDGPVSFTLGNFNGSRPYNIYASNSDILSPSDSENEYDQESTEMHFVLFRNGQRPNVPVCVRESNFGVSLKGGMQIWSVVLASLVMAWTLF